MKQSTRNFIMVLWALPQIPRCIRLANSGAVRPLAHEPDWLVGVLWLSYRHATKPEARNTYYAAAAEWALRQAQKAVQEKLADDLAEASESYARFYRPPPRR